MTLRVEIEIDGQVLWRNYTLEDGQVPESAKQGLQEMVDTLLENNN